MDETQETTQAEEAEVESTPEAEIDWKAEAEKWKNLSRKNERQFKDMSKELETYRQQHMSEQEKALEAAKAEARAAALSEVGTTLVEAEIRAKAAESGVQASTDYLDLNRFLGEDGKPDSEQIGNFIASLPAPANTKQAADVPDLMGAGHHSGGASAISTMDPNELADAISGGSFI